MGTSGRCSERGFLEFHPPTLFELRRGLAVALAKADQVLPFAAGGEAVADNIQLRCKAHNAYEAECYFGPGTPTVVRESARPVYSVQTEFARHVQIDAMWQFDSACHCTLRTSELANLTDDCLRPTSSPLCVLGADPVRTSITPTSYMQRQNLSMWMSMRRFTRLTNAFSKKVENHRAAVALRFTFYNFCCVHQTLRVTPAMEAGLTDRVLVD